MDYLSQLEWSAMIKQKGGIAMDKQKFKKSPEELQEYFKFRRRGFAVPPKKGKGSYKRRKKHKIEVE